MKREGVRHVRGETDAVNDTWQQRNRRLSGSPPSFAESPLAAFWERASDRHVQAADNVTCIRETRREVEAIPDPEEAVARAHERAGTVLVTGSLYLLADLAQAQERSSR